MPKKCACGSYCRLPERIIHGARKLWYSIVGSPYEITHKPIEKCGECGERAYWHSNVGAALLWCDEHGVLATQTPTRDPTKRREKQMSDEQWEEFVEEEFGSER